MNTNGKYVIWKVKVVQAVSSELNKAIKPICDPDTIRSDNRDTIPWVSTFNQLPHMDFIIPHHLLRYFCGNCKIFSLFPTIVLSSWPSIASNLLDNFHRYDSMDWPNLRLRLNARQWTYEKCVVVVVDILVGSMRPCHESPHKWGFYWPND